MYFIAILIEERTRFLGFFLWNAKAKEYAASQKFENIWAILRTSIILSVLGEMNKRIVCV